MTQAQRAAILYDEVLALMHRQLLESVKAEYPPGTKVKWNPVGSTWYRGKVNCYSMPCVWVDVLSRDGGHYTCAIHARYIEHDTPRKKPCPNT